MHTVLACIVFLLRTVEHHGKVTAEKIASQRVNECPRNKTEWREASNRLNCSEDNLTFTNIYHCLPVNGLTHVLEFCYNRTRAQVVAGLCMVYVKGKNILHHSNCSGFNEGCPNTSYYSEETYKFPKCTEINPAGRCYIATRCPPVTDLEKLNKEGPNILIIVVLIILGVGGVLLGGIFMRRRRENKDEPSGEQQPLLNVDSTVKMPREIVYWDHENKDKFVSIITSRKMNMFVFSGSGMVIGCAEAGKTTLVKKLKGEKNLKREATMGLEIHPHEFKLNHKESTITVCTGKEKEKGCLCLTLTTLGYEENTKPDDSKTKDIRKHSTALKHGEQQDSSAMPIALNKEAASYTASVETCQQSDKQTNSFNTCTDTMKREDQANDTSQDCLDLSDCPVYERNLKMLSLLDFAGHSAYYACHHIFFSPRAFFILVVDMTKDLQSVATDACKETDLIYSKWTFGDYIKYWLGSIHTYSSTTAPVILVGTHYDKITSPNEKESEVLQRFFENICSLLPSSLKDHLNQERVFCVEKRSGKNMKELKECIASTLKSQSHWGDNVPISWIKIQTVLKELKSKKTYLFTRLYEDVQNKKDLNISEEELIRALTFFHEVGMVMFRSEIKDIIILDVQWFVDAFKCIIRDKRHLQKNIYALDDYKELGRIGLLSRNLLNDLWRDEEFKEHKENLVKHMKQLDMLATLNEDLWYVPCMNKQQYSQDILENCNVSSTLCFLFKFLPFVIFHRLIVACINNLKMKPWTHNGMMCIYHTVTILSCKDTNQRLLIGIRENKNNSYPEHSYSIELQAIETKTGETDCGFCSRNTNIKENICEILDKLTKTFPSSEESFCIGYRCKVEPYSKTPKSNILLQEDISKLNVDCSMCKPVHVVQDAESILGDWEVYI